jgi:hypothetical protein
MILDVTTFLSTYLMLHSTGYSLPSIICRCDKFLIPVSAQQTLHLEPGSKPLLAV